MKNSPTLSKFATDPIVPTPDSKYTAKTADVFELYNLAVCNPEDNVRTLLWAYRNGSRRGRSKQPIRLCEDFCGTALTASAWVRGKFAITDAYAVGIDLSGEEIAWCKDHVQLPDGSLPLRVLHVGNVLRAAELCKSAKGFDIIFAFNFSIGYIHTWSDLITYFEGVRERLADGGVYVCDALCGPSSNIDLRHSGDYMPQHDPTPVGGTGSCPDFWMRFDLVYHDRLTGMQRWDLDFFFPDGSTIRGHFSYVWRHWSVPQIVDAMRLAGFHNFMFAENDDDAGPVVLHRPPTYDTEVDLVIAS